MTVPSSNIRPMIDRPQVVQPPMEHRENGEDAARLLLDLSGIDLNSKILTREQIELRNPHRGQMSLLDGVIWQSEDQTAAVAVHHVRHDEFWVPGHFPNKPIMPGVLQVEAGAQMACFQWLVRNPGRFIVAFLRIEDASFRSMISPGCDLFILCKDVKFGRRRFIADVQGIAAGKIAFDARVSGMSIPDPRAESETSIPTP
jgi:3-hydroxyacyl-[acyl-carrier-protein] dehydratase